MRRDGAGGGGEDMMVDRLPEGLGILHGRDGCWYVVCFRPGTFELDFGAPSDSANGAIHNAMTRMVPVGHDSCCLTDRGWKVGL